MSETEYIFDLNKAKEVLGGIPDANELSRLVDNYKSYEFTHRNGLLNGFFEGKSVRELVKQKLKDKNLDEEQIKQSYGGHARWVVTKARKTVIRLLYLRFRLEEGLTRRKANQRILSVIEFDTEASDGGQSTIRKDTYCPTLDKSTKNLPSSDQKHTLL